MTTCRAARVAAALCAALAVAAAAVATTPAARAEDGLRKFSTQLGNIETHINALLRTYANPTAIVRRFPNERRLIDARVFYALGQYENAAMLLFDLVERPDFRDHLEFEATQLLLGDCLLQMDNPRAARDIFLRVARGRDAELAEEARQLLLELILRDPNATEEQLRDAVLELGGGGSGSERTRYGLGKAEIRLGDAERALEWLESIPRQSPLYDRARFYMATAYVMKEQLDLAFEVFTALTTVPVVEPISGRTDPVKLELRDQAWLAVGRLLVERGDFDRALVSYQNIARYSPHYEAAVYEMSWAYINQDKYDKALQTVEVLLLTVQNDKNEIDAHVLRGQLNVMLQHYDDALQSYRTIVDRFAPVRNELAEFAKKPEAVQRYFRWLLERHEGDLGALQSPLSEKTVRWLDSNADFSRVSAVFERIATERHDIAQAREAGQDLGKMLEAKNRVEMFPELRQGWTQALVLENQLVVMATRLLDHQHDVVKDRLDDKGKGELRELVEWRRRLEDRAARLPTSFEAYEARQDQVMRRYRELERKHFHVQDSIDEVQRQLLGVERFLNNKQYADEGEKLTPEQEASLRADIESEKRELQKMYDELAALKKEILIETMSVGTGDDATRGEDSLKQALLAALVREGAFYDVAGSRLGGSFERDFRIYGGLRQRILGAVDRLDRVIAAIDKEVGDKTAELIAVVKHEVENLEGYQHEVGRLDEEGRDIARRMGEDFFTAALARVDRVVLEADVGVLDVMWARKDEKTRELQRLSQERDLRVRQLAADLEALKSGAGDDSSLRLEPPKPEQPKPETETPGEEPP